MLIEAIAILRETRPDVKLLIAGKGSLGPDLLASAERRGVSDACIFAGHRTDVVEIFHALDVFVQSSDTEGAPNAVLEAMALETPIVATDVGGTRDLVNDGVHGLLVPRRKPAALAAAIARTIDDRKATACRVAAARRRVEQELSFDVRMGAVERIYDELVAQYETAAASVKVGAWVPMREKR